MSRKRKRAASKVDSAASDSLRQSRINKRRPWTKEEGKGIDFEYELVAEYDLLCQTLYLKLPWRNIKEQTGKLSLIWYVKLNMSVESVEAVSNPCVRYRREHTFSVYSGGVSRYTQV